MATACARRFVGRPKIAPENRLLADHTEGVGAELCAVASLGNAARIVQDEPQTAIRHHGHPAERLRLRAPVLKIRIRNATPGADVEQAILRIHVRESTKEHGVRYGEDGRVYPDAERQGGHCHQRECRIVDQSPKTKSNIAQPGHAFIGGGIVYCGGGGGLMWPSYKSLLFSSHEYSMISQSVRSVKMRLLVQGLVKILESSTVTS